MATPASSRLSLITLNGLKPQPATGTVTQIDGNLAPPQAQGPYGFYTPPVIASTPSRGHDRPPSLRPSERESRSRPPSVVVVGPEPTESRSRPPSVMAIPISPRPSESRSRPPSVLGVSPGPSESRSRPPSILVVPASDTKNPDKPLGTKPSPWEKLVRKAMPESYADHAQLEDALRLVVSNSSSPPAVLVCETSLGPASRYTWLSHLFSAKALEKLFASQHLGNYYIVRVTGEKKFEDMPIYARIGMHLLFHGSLQIRLLRWRSLRKLLKSESIRQGKIYDSTDPAIVMPHIASFIETYNIDLSELLQPDLRMYKTFNEFFSRKLRPEARKPAFPNDPSVVVSAADCRLMVWPTWDASRKFWVKGRHFTLYKLLRDDALIGALGPDPCLAIFRLAPQDYHRFHSPVAGTVRSINHIPGEYYTVNPQAVNEPFDVLTANTRSVVHIRAQLAGPKGLAGVMKGFEASVAVVAVGALLVGSIGWDCAVGDSVGKGHGLGYFQYGGSTVICVLPHSLQWDTDLIKNSADGLETWVRAGERIGQFGLVDKA